MAESHSTQVPLPPSVEQLISQICTAQKQPPLDVWSRRTLSSLGEEEAISILQIISMQKVRKSFDGFIVHLARKASINDRANGGSPQRRLRLSPPTEHQQNRSPTSSTAPAPDPATPPTIPPTRLMMHLSFSEGGSSCRGTAISAQLEALGQLEFRKAFLILSYLGGKTLEEAVTVNKIQEMKSMPMNVFERELWITIGCKCDYIEERSRIKYVDWDSRQTHVYHCHVYPDGSYRFKGPYLTKLRNFLQRTLGDDNVLMVKFSEEVVDERNSDGNSIDYYYATYTRVFREGILIGLRRYRFFVFKDGGKEEKKRDSTSSSVKCFFVRVESDASIDNREYILSGKTVREARSLFMHADTLSSVPGYMARFSLILSKTVNLDIDLSRVNVERIEDVPCLDADGNFVYDKDGKQLIHSDGTGFISQDLASKCPKNIHRGNIEGSLHSNESKEMCAELIHPECAEPPLLIQFRLFNNGTAVKGTFLLNKKLPPQTIHVRPSMIKVETDPHRSRNFTKNSLEIVGTSNKPKGASLSKILIALLSYGGVPDEFFMGILDIALQDAQSALSKKRAALRVALNHGEMDDFLAARMIFSGIPLEEPYLQYRLSVLAKVEKKALRMGRIPVHDSYYLMGTVDPTGILKSDQVCIVLDNGHISGKVLVYRNPGLHFGDIHVLTATYVKELEDFVGNAKYAIFFPCKGARSLADEIAGGDFDGDMYFISRNPQLLEKFEQREPWSSSSSICNVPNKKPSELSGEDLEDELCKLFLRTRFLPSYTVGEAADGWLALMDRLLTLGADCTSERDSMKENMCRLIDIYYDALDAPKKGGRKIDVPECLKPEFFPHYMERKEEKSYKSTSILGKIFDKVKSYEELDLSTIEIWKLPCFDVEIHETCRTKWQNLYDQYRIEMRDALQHSKAISEEAASEVVKKYKQLLYEAVEFEESKRRKKDIFDEAIAIYQITYRYAESQGMVSYCNFAWRVAGAALCEICMSENQRERPIRCLPSVLKEVFT